MKLTVCETKDLVMSRMDQYVIEWLRSNVVRRGCAAGIIKQVNKLLASIVAREDQTTRTALAEIDTTIASMETALANMSGETREVIAKELERLSAKRDELEQKAYVEQQDFAPEVMDAESVRQAIAEYAQMLDSKDSAKIRDAFHAFIVGIKVSNDQILMTIKLNAFLVGHYRHEVTFEVAADRDTVILGKPRKNKQ